MRHFATTFDYGYAPKGIALHSSLMRHCSEEWTLHILSLTPETHALLYDLQLPNVNLLSLSTFEHALHLENVKASRNWTEWCWTIASQLCEWLLPWTNEDGITYLDSDVFFHADPHAIFAEMGERSIAIVPHRFNERDRVRLAKNGEFNVGIVVFRNTDAGRRCLAQWASKTREWCFARNENGKFGDQAYLNDFSRDYGSEVCVIKHLGVNLGPWSIGNFAITKRGESVFVNDDELVAYHFHEFRDETRLTNWPLRGSDIEYIYLPYIQEWIAATQRIRQVEIANEERQKAMQELPVG